jgi:hypothetical protein
LTGAESVAGPGPGGIMRFDDDPDRQCGTAASLGPAAPVVERLVRFLDRAGQRIDAAGAVPAHSDLVDRLLASGDAAAWSRLARALAAPHRARRFATAFPEPQQLAVLRVLVGVGAARYITLLEEARAWPAIDGGIDGGIDSEAARCVVWTAVLAAVATRANADAACARIRAMRPLPALRDALRAAPAARGDGPHGALQVAQAVVHPPMHAPA